MMRAAVFVVSPMPEYAPRSSIPTSATKTWPRFVPIWSLSGPGESAILRSARSIRPSLSSDATGIPEARKNLPPSLSMSVPRRVTSSGASAASTMLTVSSRAVASASGPESVRMASVPEKRMKAMAARRCSGSGIAGARYSPSACGNKDLMCESSGGGTGRGPVGAERGTRRRRSRRPSSRASVASPGRRAPVPAVVTTCPACAAFSASAVAVAPGPSTRSSRVGEPTRKRWMSPEWTPTDMESRRRPTEVGTSAACRRAVRISTAASQACSAWSSPWKRKSRASPPNLSSSPPRFAAMRSIGPKTRLRVSTISSAPIRPRRDNRSVSAVKPETSANTSVPSRTRHRAPGVSSSHVRATGGMCRRRSIMGVRLARVRGA